MNTIHEITGTVTIADTTLAYFADGDKAHIKVDVVVSAGVNLEEGGTVFTTKSSGWRECSSEVLNASIILFLTGGDIAPTDQLYTLAQTVVPSDSELRFYP